ncbi:MAG TPA: hypothetical protein VGH28_15115 [Polyangiaceae bacterium]|jgi:hypothetical protein
MQQPFADLGELELASACRQAYMRLVVGAHVGWGKVELARWLTGPYKELAVRSATWSEPPPSLAVTNDTSLTDDRISAVLEGMRRDVLVVLRELMHPAGVSALAKLAFDTGLVAQGGDLVLPLARARMTLVDRALSLVAVDAITRPEDFEHSLFVCERCGQPTFDVAARPRGVCRVHVSGVSRP